MKRTVSQREEGDSARGAAPASSSASGGTGGGGDADQFVWRLKAQKERSEGIDSEKRHVERAEQRRVELSGELARLKRRRLDEAGLDDHLERERAQLSRQAGTTEFANWHNEEAAFNARQSKMRCVVRIREGRAKPVDVLFLMLNAEKHIALAEQKKRQREGTPSEPTSTSSSSGAFVSSKTTIADLFDENDLSSLAEISVTPQDPLAVLDGADERYLTEVKQDIATYLEFDDHHSFWRALDLLCSRALDRLRRHRSGGAAPEVPASVRSAVNLMMSGKSVADLQKLRRDIQAKLSSSATSKVPIDVEYWEALLFELDEFEAKAVLRDAYLSLAPDAEHTDVKVERDAHTSSPRSSHQRQGHRTNSGKVGYGGRVIEDKRPVAAAPVVSESRRKLEEEAAAMRARAREHASASSSAKNPDTADELLAHERAQPMGDDHEEFSMEFRLPNAGKPKWLTEAEQGVGNKRLLSIAPIQPRYFNRIQTGYVWNKHNSAHYDKDNPPPKQIFSYKFNIFYPELIDRKSAPVFEKRAAPLPSGAGIDPDNELLVFSAGAPYADIAFIVQKRQWEQSSKFGYRFSFERGVLHLWFHFKRTFYRK